jgi:hypothetical protein
MREVKPFKKWIKGRIYRWVIQLPSGVEACGPVYIISERPLVISETPEIPPELCGKKEQAGEK